MRLSARLGSQIAGQSQHRPLNHLATATGGLTQPLAVNRRGLSERCRNGSAEAQSSLNQPEFCPEGGEHLIRPTGAASISDVRPTAHIPTGALGRVLGRLSPAIANPPGGVIGLGVSWGLSAALWAHSNPTTAQHRPFAAGLGT
jgi:hypothetical protein